MTHDNIDYSNTVFYKIYCNDTTVNDIYVGHTTNFEKRKYAHNRACIKAKDASHHFKVYKFIREHGGWDNWKMDMIGFHHCNDLSEARKVEQTYFETLHATLNSIEPLPKPKVRPTTTPKVRPTSTPKVKQTFICNNCNYKCYKQSEFNKHLLTRKHEMLGNAGKKVVKVAKSYICDCGKEYKHNQSYYRHKGVCVYTNDDVLSNSVINNENNSILELILQNKELILQNKELILQNKELMNLLITKNHQTDELIRQNKEMLKTIQ